jgi:hypothetical protein
MDYYPSRENKAKLGTDWVAPGKGSTWRELRKAFGLQYLWGPADKRTNLLLTGAPIQEADRERWESGNVH